jgi:uridine kinase
MRPHVLIVGISGGSCSGKTTITRKLSEALGPERCCVLFQDSYYIDQSARFREDGGDVNFDHPDALDFTLMGEHLAQLAQGRPVQVPIYDFVTHTRKAASQLLEPKPLVLVDGTLILSQAPVRERLHRSVFLEVGEELRFERRKRRDTVERGRSLDGVVRQFLNHVKPMHDEFVETSKVHATQILASEDQVASFIASLQREILDPARGL